MKLTTIVLNYQKLSSIEFLIDLFTVIEKNLKTISVSSSQKNCCFEEKNYRFLGTLRNKLVLSHFHDLSEHFYCQFFDVACLFRIISEESK